MVRYTQAGWKPYSTERISWVDLKKGSERGAMGLEKERGKCGVCGSMRGRSTRFTFLAKEGHT